MKFLNNLDEDILILTMYVKPYYPSYKLEEEDEKEEYRSFPSCFNVSRSQDCLNPTRLDQLPRQNSLTAIFHPCYGSSSSIQSRRLKRSGSSTGKDQL